MTNLPPLVRNTPDGDVTWARLERVDFEILGYFLSCHLIIEHYIDEHLKTMHPQLDWESSRLTFSHKATLMSKFKVSDKYDCMPAIKHMNSIRNKLSHDIEFTVTGKDLEPLRAYLTKAYDKTPVPHAPKDILEQFTMMACVLFAGQISGQALARKKTRAK